MSQSRSIYDIEIKWQISVSLNLSGMAGITRVRLSCKFLKITNMDDEKGLGDKVESLIKVIMPKMAEQKKDCIRCSQRKEWLNNFGANIWTSSKKK